MGFDGPKRAVGDGPFADPTQLVAGFWIWRVRDMDEAAEWAKRAPHPMPGSGAIEIRPLFEAEDFGEALTPDLADREGRLRARLSGSDD